MVSSVKVLADGVSIGTIVSAITITAPLCQDTLVRGHTTATCKMIVDYIWCQ